MKISHLSYVLGHIFKDGRWATQDDTIIVADDIAGVKGDGKVRLLNNILLAKLEINVPFDACLILDALQSFFNGRLWQEEIMWAWFCSQKEMHSSLPASSITHLPLWLWGNDERELCGWRGDDDS